MKRRGLNTKHALRYITTAPQTYIVQVNFSQMQYSKIPLVAICKATMKLAEGL